MNTATPAFTDETRLVEGTGVFNLRHTGGYPTSDGRVTKPFQLLRSASLHTLDEKGQQILLDLGLRHVVDLRHDHETAHSPNVFKDHGTVSYHNVSLFAGLAPDRLPIGAIPTLTEMYLELLQVSSSQLVQAVLPLTTGEPVLVHCTAGKDRTGMVVALLLDLLGVDRETIVQDYALTDTYLEPMRPSLRENASKYGLDMVQYEHMISCQPEYIEAMLDHLHEEYGGAEAYLLQAGMTPEQLEAIRTNLTEQP